MSTPSLVIVGSGIKFLSHLTIEAKTYIEQSDKVLYLVNEPAMKEWIQQANSQTESLDDLYFKYPLRLQSYQAISNYILETLRKNGHLCVVVYGHPAVFSHAALEAVRAAKREGYDAKMLPGISAEDCLFSDLLIDPGSCGCQSFEATDFLVHKRKFDPNSHLILWQIDIIGELGHGVQHDNLPGIKLLLAYLTPYYEANHSVFLYEAAQYPSFEPRIEKWPLQQLTEAVFTRISTLYIPPAGQSSCDEVMLRALNMNKK